MRRLRLTVFRCLYSSKNSAFSVFCFRKRKRRTDVVVVRGRLRLYSASGFFLFLGLIILAIGICMATLGYWPHGKASRTGGGQGMKEENDATNTTYDIRGNNQTVWLQR